MVLCKNRNQLFGMKLFKGETENFGKILFKEGYDEARKQLQAGSSTAFYGSVQRNEDICNGQHYSLVTRDNQFIPIVITSVQHVGEKTYIAFVTDNSLVSNREPN